MANEELKKKVEEYKTTKDSLKKSRRAMSSIESSYLEKHAIGVAGSRTLMSKFAPNLTMKGLKLDAMFVSNIKASLTMSDQQLVEYYKNYDKVKQESNQRIDNIVNTFTDIGDAELNLRKLKKELNELESNEFTTTSAEESSNIVTNTVEHLKQRFASISDNSTSYSGYTSDDYSLDV